MTSLSSFDLRLRAGAEELSRLLDGATRSHQVSGPTLAYAGIASGLRTTGAALHPLSAPRVDFRTALRTRLMAVAAVTPAAVPARPTTAAATLSWRPSHRVGGVVAGAMASVVAVTGVAVAASQSLPGDPFYGVKRTTEALQLRTTDGEVGKGTRHLDLAVIRLQEVRGLTLGRDAARAGPRLGPTALGPFAPVLRSNGTPLIGSPGLAGGAALSDSVARRVAETLADMDSETQRGSALLTAAFRDTKTPAPLETLARFATRQSVDLVELLPALPAATQARARTSLALVLAVADNTKQLLAVPPCGPACDPAAAAPSVPPVVLPSSNPLSSTPTAKPSSDASCGCAPVPNPTAPGSTEPTPPRQSSPDPSPASPPPGPGPSPEAQPSGHPTSSPSPSGNPIPIPVPIPVPIPIPIPLPIPLPTSVASVPTVPGLVGQPELSSGLASIRTAARPSPSKTPVPALAPTPPNS